MMNHGKSRKKVPPTVSPRKKRMVCLMSEEEVQRCRTLSGAVSDKKQSTLATRNRVDFYPSEHGRRLSYFV